MHFKIIDYNNYNNINDYIELLLWRKTCILSNISVQVIIKRTFWRMFNAKCNHDIVISST